MAYECYEGLQVKLLKGSDKKMLSRAQLALMSLGICTLLPYNCLLNAQPYFKQYPFKGLQFEFTSMMIYSLGLCTSQIFLACKGDGFTVNQRMGTAFITEVIVCITFFGLTFASTSHGHQLYVPMLVTILVLAVSNAVLQTGTFGVAGSIHQGMSSAVMLGLGISGLVSFFVSLFVQAIQHATNPETSDSADAGRMVALVMWAICILQTLISCWVYFIFLRSRLPETASAIAMLEEQRTRAPSEASGMAFVPDDASSAWGQICKRHSPVFLEIWPQAMNVFGVFLVTMAIFPGVVVLWEPMAGSAFRNSKQIYHNILIGCFQVGDVLGRSITGPVGRCIGPSRLWILVLLRFGFIPLFMLGQRSPESSFVWGSDVGRLVLCAFFAITNGLAASLAMMFGPECCSVLEKREIAGMAMSAIMVTGIFCGTLLAFATQIGIA